jgi:hypothetical protein
VADPTNTTDSSGLEFTLSFLCAASDEQYESILNDEIALLARMFHALHMFCNERRRSPRGCFDCGDTTHFIADCPKRKKFDSSYKYNYNNWNDSSDKVEGKKYRFTIRVRFQEFKIWAVTPGAYRLSNFQGRMLEHSWNMENLHRFFI